MKNNKQGITSWTSFSSLFTAAGDLVEIDLRGNTNSLFNEFQFKEIKLTIECLNKEIKSCWPYPNKEVKQIKVNALTELLHNAEIMNNLSDAIADIKQKYPRACEGRFSTRTADLLHKLQPEPEPQSCLLIRN